MMKRNFSALASIAAVVACTVAGAASAANPTTPATDTPAVAAASDGKAPYKVVDGYKVDPSTLEGFRTWRAAACSRCHGANQEGMVGPSLIAGLKRLSKEEFTKVVTEGRLALGMPPFKTNKRVMEHIDDLYAYLKGRSDGAITRAKVVAMPE